MTYLPEDSPLRKAAEKIVEVWGGQYRPIWLVLPGSDTLELHRPEVRSDVRELFAALQEVKGTGGPDGPMISWVHDLQAWQSGPPPGSCPGAPAKCPTMTPQMCPAILHASPPEDSAEAFGAWMRTWRDLEPALCEFGRVDADPGEGKPLRAPWVHTAIPKAHDTTILTFASSSPEAPMGPSRLMFTARYATGEPKENVRLMEELRGVVKAHAGKVPGAFIWADWFVDAERDDQILATSLQLLLTVLVVVVIVLALTLHPMMGIVVGLVMGLVGVQVLGLLAAFGLKLDMVAFMVICMAIGFATEYVSHIAHAFVHAAEEEEAEGVEGAKSMSGTARMALALEDMGLTVFSAFLSTAAQQLVLLIFSSSYAFTKFCLVMEMVVLTSGLAGFLIVPSLLALGVDIGRMGGCIAAKAKEGPVAKE